MQSITAVINDAVSFINGSERHRHEIAEKLQKLRQKDLSILGHPDLQEQQLFYHTPLRELNCRVAGVDSGFVDKSVHAIDMILVRAVGVVFEYKENRLQRADYWPDFYHFPVPMLNNGAFDHDELNSSKSLIRLHEEINTAKVIIEKFRPDFCLLDGSIIPQYLDKPRSDSPAKEQYHGLINNFEKLYETAEQNSCQLVSCVEDSRGSRFRTILQESILPKENLIKPESLDNLFDSSLLDHLLQRGERTFAFPYSKSIDEHPILMDFDKNWANEIYAFYIKPAMLDRPLRVEFLNKGNLTETTSKIAELIYALSSTHREYAYPTVLIEADLRARLKPEEIDTVYNKILDKLSSQLKLRLRREGRPF